MLVVFVCFTVNVNVTPLFTVAMSVAQSEQIVTAEGSSVGPAIPLEDRECSGGPGQR